MGEHEEAALLAVSALLAAQPQGATDGELLGGKVNRVIRGTWRGEPAVFKYYAPGTGGHIGPPDDRQRRDWLGAGLAGACGLVPPRLARFERHRISVFARAVGRPLAVGGDPAGWRPVGEAIGRAWQELHRAGIAPGAAARYQTLCCDGLDWAHSLERLLARSGALVAAAPASGLGEGFARLAAARDALVAGPDSLVRMDNNEGNFLSQRGRLSAIIDWEQCWLAPPTIMLGFLLDREASGLPGLLAGYVRAAGRVWDDGAWDLIVRAAELTAWWRILWNGRAWRRCHGEGFDRLPPDWQEALSRRLERLHRCASGIRRSLPG